MKFLVIVLCCLIVGCSLNAPDSANTAVPVAQEVKPANPEHTNHLQEVTYVGKVKAIIHNFCTPMLDDCEPSVELIYRNRITQVDPDWPRMSGLQLSKNEISQNGKFIVIESWTGGNCGHCSGIDVFKLENEEILSLGYFSEIRNGFLVTGYRDLEQNELTSPANAPFWWLYYTENKGQISLDTDKTCNISKNNIDYSKKKNALLGLINSKNSNEDSLGEVESLILSVLSFAKWCGWDKESVEIAAKIKESGILTNHYKIQLINRSLNSVKKWDDTRALKIIKDGGLPR